MSKDTAITYPSVRVTGFFQADAVWNHQSEANRIAPVAGVPIGDIQDGADFRRTRLAATGDVADDAGYMIEMDFAFPGRPSFMDVYGEIRGFPRLGNVRFGQYRMPFGLDSMTSVRDLLFIERALPFAFVPFRQIGAGFFQANEDLGVTWAASGFRYPTDFFGGNLGDSGGYGMSTRLTALLFEGGDNATVHVGLDYSYIDSGNDLFRFRNQPEFFVAESAGALPSPVGVPGNIPPFVDTGDLISRSLNLAGVEFAASKGSLLIQSEVMIAQVDRLDGPNPMFWGANAQVAWCLTGEAHPYSKKNGVYGRIVPDHVFTAWGSLGAWELAARWSVLDLDDKDITGNVLNDLTFGVNWYLNKFTKFQFNYVHAMLDTATTGSSDADFFGTRAQMDF